MSLSKELQIGKAAEHLVCADLILQGVNAFLADQGLPYDLCADVDGRVYRVQVKGSMQARAWPKCPHSYRFGMRYARGGQRLMDASTVDLFAFVAIDLRSIAYIPVDQITRSDGKLVGMIEFRTRSHEYATGRKYPNGTRRLSAYGRFIEDYPTFPFAATR